MDEQPNLERDRDAYQRRAMDVAARIEREADSMTDEELLVVARELSFNMRGAVVRLVEIAARWKTEGV